MDVALNALGGIKVENKYKKMKRKYFKDVLTLYALLPCTVPIVMIIVAHTKVKKKTAPCSDAVRDHTACVPRPSPIKPCSSPPLQAARGKVLIDHTSQTNLTLYAKHARAQFRSLSVNTR